MAERQLQRRLAAFTLVEILVVILVMLLITVLTIPVIAPALEGRQVREAARAVDVFISGARSRAIQSGSPFGVMIRRDQNDPRMSTTLAYCEQPPDYKGDYDKSTVLKLGNGGFGAWNTFVVGNIVVDTSPVFKLNDIGWLNNVGPGDVLFFNFTNSTLYRLYSGEPFVDVNGDGQFNPGEPFNDVDGSGVATGGIPFGSGYTGPSLALDPNGCFKQVPSPVNWGTQSATITYTFADPFSASQCMSASGLNASGVPFWLSTSSVTANAFLPPSSASFDSPAGIVGSATGTSFQVSRRPIISSAPPLELPEGTCIDLGGTWVDPTNNNRVPIIGSGLDVPASMTTSGAPGALILMGTFRPNPAFDPAVVTPPPSIDQTPVIILFGADGRLQSVYSWYETNFTNPLGWQARYPVSPIYLLVGKRELIGGDVQLIQNLTTGNAPLKPIFNIQDTTSLWLTVNNSNGHTGVVENPGFDDIPGVTLNDAIPTQTSPAKMQAYLNEQAYFSRRLAREQAEMGGR